MAARMKKERRRTTGIGAPEMDALMGGRTKVIDGDADKLAPPSPQHDMRRGPDPHRFKMTKMTMNNDPEEYIHSFERTATM